MYIAARLDACVLIRLKVYLTDSKSPAMGHPLNLQTPYSRLRRQSCCRLNFSRYLWFYSPARRANRRY